MKENQKLINLVILKRDDEIIKRAATVIFISKSVLIRQSALKEAKKILRENKENSI